MQLLTLEYLKKIETFLNYFALEHSVSKSKPLRRVLILNFLDKPASKSAKVGA